MSVREEIKQALRAHRMPRTHSMSDAAAVRRVRAILDESDSQGDVKIAPRLVRRTLEGTMPMSCAVAGCGATTDYLSREWRVCGEQGGLPACLVDFFGMGTHELVWENYPTMDPEPPHQSPMPPRARR